MTQGVPYRFTVVFSVFFSEETDKTPKDFTAIFSEETAGITGKLQSIGSPKTNDKQTITAADVALKM